MSPKSLGERDNEVLLLELTEEYLENKKTEIITKGIDDIINSKHIYRIKVKKEREDFYNSLEIDFNIMIEYCQELNSRKNYLDDRDLVNGFNQEYCHFYSYALTFIQNDSHNMEDKKIQENLEELFTFFKKEHTC